MAKSYTVIYNIRINNPTSLITHRIQRIPQKNQLLMDFPTKVLRATQAQAAAINTRPGCSPTIDLQFEANKNNGVQQKPSTNHGCSGYFWSKSDQIWGFFAKGLDKTSGRFIWILQGNLQQLGQGVSQCGVLPVETLLGGDSLPSWRGWWNVLDLFQTLSASTKRGLSTMNIATGVLFHKSYQNWSAFVATLLEPCSKKWQCQRSHK